MLLGICHTLVMLVHGRPGDDVGAAADSGCSQRDGLRECSTSEEFFTPQETIYLQRLYVENRISLGSYKRSGARKGKFLHYAREQSPSLLAHFITRGAYEEDTVEEAMRHLVSLTVHLKFDDNEKQAVFDLLHKLFTRECFVFLRKDSGVLRSNEDYVVTYRLDYLDTESGIVFEIRKELERPMNDLYDSYLTPPSSADPSTSETDSANY
ncbi:hypothetical protein PAPHI01_1554 [Pancytospora philotis]|nr:hypothetical protein PAPHI01_1554 [Pancytospora philotis]